jgi:alcohol dehydrogenase class IV
MGETLRLSFPRGAVVGPGTVQRLGEEAAALGRRALLVTGRKALRQAGVTSKLLGILAAAGILAEVFDDVPPEPDVAGVDRARERLGGCDLVIEVGGGSAIDVGKAAAALAMGDAPTAEYLRGRKLPPAGLPHIAVPTTAGTGSEVTTNSVLIDPACMVKKSIRGASLLPDVCIVDGDLTLSCPPRVTAASGMDAMSQAIEAFVSIHAVPTTDALALAAVRQIVASLPVAHAHGEDRRARAAMLEASFMGGLAFANARLGAVHGLAHPMGLIYRQPHGVVCAILLPAVLRQNAPVVKEKYARLRDAMGGDPADRAEELLREMALPLRFGPAPSSEQERMLLDYALSAGSSKANPVPVDEAYVRAVLAAVCA